MDAITVAPGESPVASEIVASTASRITSGLSIARQSSLPNPARWSFASTLGPYSARRVAASLSVSPSARVFSFA